MPVGRGGFGGEEGPKDRALGHKSRKEKKRRGLED